jgi:hypothetical protein
MTKSKKIKIEPSPFVSTKIKVKMSMPRTTSAGFAVKDQTTGKISTMDVDPPNMIQVPGTSKTIAPLLTPSGLRTGLEFIVDNPYKDLDVYMPTWGEKVLKGKEKASLQHILEYKHGREYDYYTNKHFDKIFASHTMNDQPFFLTDKSKLLLDGNVVYLNLDNPLDEIKYYLCRIHPYIANSYEELNEGKNLSAKYFISDSESKVDVKAEKIMRQNKAIAALEDLNSKEDSMVINMALALGMNDTSVSKEKSYSYVYNTMNRSDQDFAIFMKYYSMYKDKARREYWLATALLQELLNYRVVSQRNNKIYWVQPETDTTQLTTLEWKSKEAMINEFLTDPAYQKEVKMIKDILASRK